MHSFAQPQSQQFSNFAAEVRTWARYEDDMKKDPSVQVEFERLVIMANWVVAQAPDLAAASK